MHKLVCNYAACWPPSLLCACLAAAPTFAAAQPLNNSQDEPQHSAHKEHEPADAWLLVCLCPCAHAALRSHAGWLCVQGVLQAILTVMGLTKANVNDADTLSRLGIDSMQMVEVSVLVLHALLHSQRLGIDSMQMVEVSVLVLHALLHSHLLQGLATALPAAAPALLAVHC